MALTADLNVSTEGVPKIASVQVDQADTWYRGALIWVDLTNGLATCANMLSGDRILGICTKKQTTTAANQKIDIMVGGLIWLPKAAGTGIADIGDWLNWNAGTALTDDPTALQSATDATLAAPDAKVGQILDVDLTLLMVLVNLKPGTVYSATLGWI
jgi:hypothetical protein